MNELSATFARLHLLLSETSTLRFTGIPASYGGWIAAASHSGARRTTPQCHPTWLVHSKAPYFKLAQSHELNERQPL